MRKTSSNMKSIIEKMARLRRNIYLSLLVGSIISGTVVVVLSVLLTLFSRALEHPIPEANVLRLAYTHAGMIVAAISMVCGYLAIFVTLKLNESVKIQEFNAKYAEDAALDAIRAIANVKKIWKDGLVGDFKRPDFVGRSLSFNPEKRIDIKNKDVLTVNGECRHPWTETQDRARRMIKNYFLAAYQLYNDRSIGKAAFLDICSKDALVLFFDVVEPMEAMINNEYEFKPFYGIMRAFGSLYEEAKKKAEDHDAKQMYWDFKEKKWVLEKNLAQFLEMIDTESSLSAAKP